MSGRRPFTLVAIALAVTAAAPAAPALASAAHAKPGSSSPGVAPASALPPLAPGDWTGSRNKAAGGGYNQAETTIRPDNAQAIHIVNHIQIGPWLGGPQSAATGHGQLYAGQPGGGIAAYDEIGWTQKWAAGQGSDLIVVGDDAVYTINVDP